MPKYIPFKKQKSQHSSNSNAGPNSQAPHCCLTIQVPAISGSRGSELYGVLPVSHSGWHLELWEFQSPSYPQILFFQNKKKSRFPGKHSAIQREFIKNSFKTLEHCRQQKGRKITLQVILSSIMPLIHVHLRSPPLAARRLPTAKKKKNGKDFNPNPSWSEN